MIEDALRKMIRDEVHATLIGREHNAAETANRIDLACLTVLAEDIRGLMERLPRLSRTEQIGVLHELNDLEHAINDCRVAVLMGLMEGERL